MEDTGHLVSRELLQVEAVRNYNVEFAKLREDLRPIKSDIAEMHEEASQYVIPEDVKEGDTVREAQARIARAKEVVEAASRSREEIAARVAPTSLVNAVNDRIQKLQEQIIKWYRYVKRIGVEVQPKLLPVVSYDVVRTSEAIQILRESEQAVAAFRKNIEATKNEDAHQGLIQQCNRRIKAAQSELDELWDYLEQTTDRKVERKLLEVVKEPTTIKTLLQTMDEVEKVVVDTREAARRVKQISYSLEGMIGDINAAVQRYKSTIKPSEAARIPAFKTVEELWRYFHDGDGWFREFDGKLQQARDALNDPLRTILDTFDRGSISKAEAKQIIKENRALQENVNRIIANTNFEKIIGSEIHNKQRMIREAIEGAINSDLGKFIDTFELKTKEYVPEEIFREIRLIQVFLREKKAKAEGVISQERPHLKGKPAEMSRAVNDMLKSDPEVQKKLLKFRKFVDQRLVEFGLEQREFILREQASCLREVMESSKQFADAVDLFEQEVSRNKLKLLKERLDNLAVVLGSYREKWWGAIYRALIISVGVLVGVALVYGGLAFASYLGAGVFIGSAKTFMLTVPYVSSFMSSGMAGSIGWVTGNVAGFVNTAMSSLGGALFIGGKEHISVAAMTPVIRAVSYAFGFGILTQILSGFGHLTGLTHSSERKNQDKLLQVKLLLSEINSTLSKIDTAYGENKEKFLKLLEELEEQVKSATGIMVKDRDVVFGRPAKKVTDASFEHMEEPVPASELAEVLREVERDSEEVLKS